MNQLPLVELKVGDEEQAMLILSSLPDSWDTLVVSLGNSAPGSKLTMVMVKNALSNEEAKRNETGTDQADAFIAEGMHQRRGR